MRRIWLAILSLLLIMTVAAGCGSATPTSAPAPAPSQSDTSAATPKAVSAAPAASQAAAPVADAPKADAAKAAAPADQAPGASPAAAETPAPAPAAAAAPQANTATAYPVTLRDDAGRQVTIAAEPKRILSLAPSNTELVWALGKGAEQVGRTDYCDYPAEVKSIPSIGGIINPDYEKIVSLKPDLVLMISGSDDVRNKLVNEFKLNVFVMEPKNLDEFYAGIKTLGVALNAQDQANQVALSMQSQVKAISDKAAQTSFRPKAFYEVWDNPLMTAGQNTFVNDLIRLAGGENVGAAVQGWTTFNTEQLVAADPDWIVAGPSVDAAKIKGVSGWQSLKAVKTGKVVNVPDDNWLSRPGPRLVLGLKWFAETLHPELFPTK